MKSIVLAVALTLSGFVVGQDTIEIVPHEFTEAENQFLLQYNINDFLSISDRYNLTDPDYRSNLSVTDPKKLRLLDKRFKKFKLSYGELQDTVDLSIYQNINEFRQTLKGNFTDPSMNMSTLLDIMLSNHMSGPDTLQLQTEKFILGTHIIYVKQSNVLSIQLVDLVYYENEKYHLRSLIITEQLDGSYDYIRYYNSGYTGVDIPWIVK